MNVRKEEREKIISIIKNVLENIPDVSFAYVFGSFVQGEIFSDIDVGVYLRKEPENPWKVIADIKIFLSKEAHRQGINLSPDDFDVSILNFAPFTFLYRVFTEGTLIFERDEILRANVIEAVSLKFRECAELLMESRVI